MREEQGEKSPETGELPGRDEEASAPAKPTDLSDADLDKMAGGAKIGPPSTVWAPPDSKIAKNKFTLP